MMKAKNCIKSAIGTLLLLLFVQMGIAQTKKVDGVLQKAKALYQSIERFDINANDGTPRSIRGILAKNVNLNDPTQIKQFMRNSKSIYRINETSDDFVTRKVFKDELNMTHAKLYQTYKGIPVFGSEINMHSDASNTIIEVNGKFTPDLNLDVIPIVTSENALNIALADLGPAEYRWQNDAQEKIIKLVYHDKNRTWKPAPELVIAPQNGDFDNGKYKLAWKFEVALDGAKFGNWEYFIDAKTGEIINKFNSMPDAIGTGVSNYNGTVPIYSQWEPLFKAYQLTDTVRNIQTLNYAGYFLGTYIRDADNDWDQNKSAVDVHWGIGKAYDFYKDIFHRNSFDDSCAEIYNSVNCTDPPFPNNAGWNGSYFAFGTGDEVNFSSVTELGTCGHEFTHAVTSSEYEANLVYHGERGALQEAMSDILGTAIEFYVDSSKANWQIGEESFTPGVSGDALRYMDNPNIGNPNQCGSYNPRQPNTYLGTYWADTSGYGCDRGGVHINCGVLNYAFYLMTVGGADVNDFDFPYTVTGIGIVKTRAIAYKALTAYFNKSTDFLAARTAFLSAASDLYESTGPEYKAVYDAFGAVGIGIKLTAKNSFDAGTIKVNSETKNSGFTYYASSGETQTYEAIPQPHDSLNCVWNTKGAATSISHWKEQNSAGLTFILDTTKSYTFIASSSDHNATYIADLKIQYNISLTAGTILEGGNGGEYEINGTNVGATHNGTIVQDNTDTLKAVSANRDVFISWSDGVTANPRYVSPSGNTTFSAIYKAHLGTSSLEENVGNGGRKIVRDSSGNLYAVYSSNNSIWFTRNMGNGWEGERYLGEGTNPSIKYDLCYFVKEFRGEIIIEYEYDYLVVVWEKYSNTTGFEVYFRCSKSGGAGWHPIIKFDTNLEYAPEPVVPDSIHTVWRKNNIGLNVRRKDGSNHIIERLNEPIDKPELPSVSAFSDGSIGLVCKVGNSIKYTRCTCYHDSIHYDVSPIVISSSGANTNPSLAVYGNTVFAVWRNTTSGNICFRQSDNSGATWGTIQELSNGTMPSVGVDNKNGVVTILCQNGSRIGEFVRELGNVSAPWSSMIDLGAGTGPTMLPDTNSNYSPMAMWTTGNSAPYTINLSVLPAIQTISGSIASDATLSGIINVNGSVTVNSGATLNISPGSHLFFASGTGITILPEAKIIANGTAEQPIKFRKKDNTAWAAYYCRGTITNSDIVPLMAAIIMSICGAQATHFRIAFSEMRNAVYPLTTPTPP